MIVKFDGLIAKRRRDVEMRKPQHGMNPEIRMLLYGLLKKKGTGSLYVTRHDPKTFKVLQPKGL